MLRVSRVRRGPVSFAGAAVLLIGLLGLLSSNEPIEARQAATAQATATSTRMPDGSEFPTWERPLRFTKTYYVNGSAPNASDAGPGTQQQPFKTISKAADVLQPGERVVIASGIYREVIRPKRGGTGPEQMISYEAADGANVIVRGSQVVSEGWQQTGAGRGGAQGRGGGAGGAAPAGRGAGAGGGQGAAAAAGGRAQGRAGGAAGFAGGGGRGGGRGGAQAPTWDVDLDGSWFNGYNPFGSVNMPQQRWQYMNRMSINVHNILVPYTRVRGMLFVDGKPLDQVRVTSELFGRDPSWAIGSRGQPYSAELFGEIGGGLGKYFVDQSGLSLRVRMPNDESPEGHLVEATTKAQIFVPEPGLGYIRVKGITFEHAGNNFPFPQTGMVSTSGGNHFIFEGNTFQWANSICLSVGGGGGSSHIIRGNTMRYCGLSGLTGMGTNNLLVENNLFEWIGWQDAEHMSESAGIKFHNARNLLLRNNVIRHMRHASGIWLDVGNVNCRLTRNVFADIVTAHAGIWIEASHEQDQVDNNLIIDVREDRKQTPHEVETGGGSGFYILGTDKLIIANNLVANTTRAGVHFRTEEIRIISGRGGLSRENKVYDNLFVNTGESAVNFENEHNTADGNMYASVPGGYLRILRPGRPELLDVAAARDYYGWEKNGRSGSAQVSLDPDTLKLTFSVNGEVPKVPTFNGTSITNDFFGAATGDSRVPGAFADLTAMTAKDVDPRK